MEARIAAPRRECLPHGVIDQTAIKAGVASALARKDYAALKRLVEPWLANDLAPLIR
jgi:hypothetical protein